MFGSCGWVGDGLGVGWVLCVGLVGRVLDGVGSF